MRRPGRSPLPLRAAVAAGAALVLLSAAAPAAAGTASPGSSLTDRLDAPALPAGLLTQPPSQVSGYDGANPFDCRIQQMGTGVDFPDPDADPFCVEYDKTNQNLTNLGIIDFLRNEPARVAAAVDKCFYYQRDHWHASVNQRWEATEIYNWDGAYYFDKARGAFGVYVENFTINNSSVDPTGFPGFPSEWEPYFGYGQGGVQVLGEIPVVPRCVEKAEQRDPYQGTAGGG